MWFTTAEGKDVYNKLLIVYSCLIQYKSLEILLRDFLFCFWMAAYGSFPLTLYIPCINEILGLLFITSSDQC